MISNNLLSKTLCFGRLFIPHNYFYIPLAGVKTKDTIQLPEKPKKPLSSFLRFVQEHKLALIKEDPQLKVTDIVKKCAEDWKNVHPTVKHRYDNEFKEEMEAYSKNHLDYSMKLTDEQKDFIKELNKEKRESSKKRKDRKRLKDMHKPKKPISAFLMYLLEKSKLQGRKVNELMKEMKGEWALLDESKKLPYFEKAQILMEKYREDLKTWETLMIQEGHIDLVRRKTLDEHRPATARKKTDTTKKNEKEEVNYE